jgi:hypothetical protein
MNVVKWTNVGCASLQIVWKRCATCS